MKPRFFLFLTSVFLLGLTSSILIFQFVKAPKTAQAVVGTLNINAGTSTNNNYFPGGVWTPSGNVGIGTTAPGAKLDILDSANETGVVNLISNNGSNAVYYYAQAGGVTSGIRMQANAASAGLITTASTIPLTFQVNYSEKMRIDNGGNVGIGTTSPNFLLSLQGSGNPGVGFANNGTYEAAAALATCAGCYSADSLINDFVLRTQGANGKILLNTNGGGGASTLAINGGNVGIGTTGPLAKLHVITSNDTTPTSIGAYDARYLVVGGTPNNAGGIFISYDQSSNIGHIGVLQPSIAWGNLELAPAGNVGIGTAGPGTKLDVGTSTSDTIRSYGGFVGNAAANIGGTGAAAYFPNGAWLNGGNEWIYGSVTFNGAVTGATSLNVSGPIITSNAPSSWGDLRTGSIDSNNVYGYRSLCVGNSSGTCDSTNGIVIGLTNTSAYTNLPSSGNSFIGGSLGIGKNPAYTLDVNGVINATGAHFNNNNVDGIYTLSAAQASITNYVSAGTSVASYNGQTTLSGYDGWAVLASGGCQYEAGAWYGTGFGMDLETTHGAYLLNCNGSSTKGIIHFDTGGTSHGAGWVTPYADYAEIYQSNEKDLRKGDLLTLDTNHNDQVIKTKDEGDIPMGVYSTKPGFVSNSYDPELGTDPTKPKPKIPLNPNVKNIEVALIGKVPLKVTTKNGSIAINDVLTSSSLPGVAGKPTKAGFTVAKALGGTGNWNLQNCPSVTSPEAIVWPEDPGTGAGETPKPLPCFKLPDGTYIGKIMAFVNVSWYDPDIALTNTGNLKIVGENSNYKLQNSKDNTTVTRIAAFAEAVVAKIQAGLIETKQLIVDGVDIGKKLEDLSQKVSGQQKTIDSQQQQINALQKQIEQLKK